MEKTSNNKVDSINKIDNPNNSLKTKKTEFEARIGSTIEYPIDIKKDIDNDNFLASLSSRENVAQQIYEYRIKPNQGKQPEMTLYTPYTLRGRILRRYDQDGKIKYDEVQATPDHKSGCLRWDYNKTQYIEYFQRTYKEAKNDGDKAQWDRNLADVIILQNDLSLQINQDYDPRSEKKLKEELEETQKRLQGLGIDTVPIIGTAKNNIKYYTLVKADQLLQYVKQEKQEDIKRYLKERKDREGKTGNKEIGKEKKRKDDEKPKDSPENKQEIPEYEKEQRSERLLLAKYLSERRRNSQNGNIQDQYIRLNDNFDINITKNKVYYIPKDNSGKIMERPFRFIDHIRDIINAPISQQEKDRKLMAFDIEMAERIILGLPKGVIEIKPEQGGIEEAQKIVDGYKNDPVIGNLEIVPLDNNNRIGVRKREQPLQNG